MNFISHWSTPETFKETLEDLPPKLMAEERLIQKFNPKRQDGLALVGETSGTRTFKKNFRNSNDRGDDNNNCDKKPSNNYNKGYRSSNRNWNSNPTNNMTRDWQGQSNNHFSSSWIRNNVRNKPQHSEYKCLCCKEKGHLIEDCPKNRTSARGENAEAVAESYHSGPVDLQSGGWILDSGATEYMSGSLNLFKSYKKLVYPELCASEIEIYVML